MLYSASNIQRALKSGTASFHRSTPALDFGNRALQPFYNRPREVEELSASLHGPPRFTVLLGPPSSGKTALTQYVTSQKRTDDSPAFHSLTVNLRSINTLKGSFVKALVNECLDPTAPTPFWKGLLKRFEISYKDLRVGLNGDEANRSSNTAVEIFQEMGKNLRPWSFWHGERPPVLIIEEANALKEINDDVSVR